MDFTAVLIALVEFTGSTLAWLKGGMVGALLWPAHVKLIPAIDPELSDLKIEAVSNSLKRISIPVFKV